MFIDQQNRYTSLDKCLKIDFFNKKNELQVWTPHFALVYIKIVLKFDFVDF